MADKTRAFTAGRFALALDGEGGGFVRKVAGGATQTETIKEAAGPTNISFKNIGKIFYEEITVECGMAMSPGFYEWIKASWRKEYIRKSGAIISCDSYYRERYVREFSEALITKTTFPEFNGSEKKACYMTVSFAPERIRYKKGDESSIKGKFGTGQQKKWLSSNFRFQLGGLDCKKVNKIDAFSIEQTFATDEVGGSRETSKEPANTKYPDLKVTIAEVDLPSWHEWFESFVVRGNSGKDNELNGSITFISPNLQKDLGSVDLFGVGIYNLRSADQAVGNSTISRFTVDLYVEEMDFNYEGDAVIKS